MRTFVFISNIPDFLLQPIYKNEASKDGDKDANAKKSLTASKFDLRYERLRRLLVEHSSGVMLVMHLETKGYALALYASEGEALAACKADITPEQPGQKYTPLRLRILEKEKPRPPEPVYNPYLTVEGEEVRKVDLADTRGLELVYRGRAVAKWCPRTLAGEDCHFGVSCSKLHKAAVQRTVRKRPRIDEEDAAPRLSSEQQRTVRQLLACVKDARAALAPASLQMQGCRYVPVTQVEMEAICEVPAESASGETSAANDNDNNNSSRNVRNTAYTDVLRRVQAAMTTSTSCSSSGTTSTAPSSFCCFPRLSCPGGAPWDWTVESAAGRALLRRDCPLPANGAPTPLERDLYIQRLWYHMNQRNRCRTAQEVLQMLQGSRRVREALRDRRTSSHAKGVSSLAATAARVRVDTNTTAASDTESASDCLFICLEPWLYLPTVGCEVTAFLEWGGRRVRGVVQRYGQLRLMTSATLLVSASQAASLPTGSESCAAHNEIEEEEGGEGAVHLETAAHAAQAQTSGEEADDVEALLCRYAVLESGSDGVAEASLSKELRVFQRCVAAAINDLSRHLRHHPASTGGEGAAWCVHLAVALPHPLLSSSSSSASSLSLRSGELATPTAASARVPPANTSAAAAAVPSVVLLSCSAYQRALEECSLYSALAPPASSSSAAAAAAGEGGGEEVEVTWNTQRHPYIPLFSREVLERLRADATD